MNQRVLRITLLSALLTALVGLAAALRSPAEPTLGRDDPVVAQLVCEFLKQGHLARPEINDELSRRLFKRYLKDLDPTKRYFTQVDVDEFKRHETELDDLVQKGDMSFAYQVYERYLKRMGERMKLVEELVEARHDFTVTESMENDPDHYDWAKDDAEMRERWRKRIKFDLLLERLEAKPLPEAEQKQKVLNRYKSLHKRIRQLDNYDLMEFYLSGLSTSLDPHSTYMSPSTLEDFDVSMRLNLEGIGALLRQQDGYTVVAEVIAGGAAAADGKLKVNDKIVGVSQGGGDFVDVVDMKLRDVVKLIRGARGTKVHLKIIPTGKLEPVVYEYTRKKIELKNQEARGEILDQGKKADGTPYKVGVIDLPSFYGDLGGRGDSKSATEDVRKLLKEYAAKGIDGLVLDLRRNGGGSLSEAVALTGLFLDKGPVVQVKGGGRLQSRSDPEAGFVYDGPMVVLVSRFSASASEILAGALQDYGRALVVGDSSTHGKGTVQMLVSLGDQVRAANPPKLGALKLTIQQFYRVNGDSTQNRGVQADVVVPSLTEHLSKGESELDHALAFDQIKALRHDDYRLVPDDVRAALKAKSAARVKDSTDFAKLAKDIDKLKARKDRKTITLNEKELKEQFSKDDAEKADKENGGPVEPENEPSENGAYKFKRNFTNNEILSIVQDLLETKKAAVRR